MKWLFAANCVTPNPEKKGRKRMPKKKRTTKPSPLLPRHPRRFRPRLDPMKALELFSKGGDAPLELILKSLANLTQHGSAFLGKSLTNRKKRNANRMPAIVRSFTDPSEAQLCWDASITAYSLGCPRTINFSPNKFGIQGTRHLAEASNVSVFQKSKISFPCYGL